MEAANRVSQRLSYSSTHRNAGGLNFRVRDGYGCNPAAMAALTPTRGVEPRTVSGQLARVRCTCVGGLETTCTCDPVCAWTRFTEPMRNEWWLWPVSARGLNVSLPRRVHPESIDLVFYEWPQRCLFSRWVSGLDAFSRYPVWRGCPAVLSRTTGTPVATNRSSSRTIRSFPSGTKHPQ
jgi:hypothetical protein